MSESKKEQKKNKEPDIEKPLINENPPITFEACKFKRESNFSKWMFQVPFLLIGAILGYAISRHQINTENEKAKIERTKSLINSVVEEIGFNENPKISYDFMIEGGDSSFLIKRQYKYSSLDFFINHIPELKIRNDQVRQMGLYLRGLILAANQFIDQRNYMKAQPTSKMNFNIRQNIVVAADSLIARRYNKIIDFGKKYEDILDSELAILST